MSESTQRGRGWPWILGVALVGLFGVLAYLMSGDGDSSWGEPGDELAEGRERRRVGRSGSPELRAPDGEEPAFRVPRREPTPPPEPFAPEELAGALFDGGRPPPEAGLPVVATLAVDVEEPETEPEPPQPAPEPVRIGPTPPETAHRRAVFWRDLLVSRIDALRREAEAAREAGDEARLRRTTRMLERLEAQRPNANAQVSELERALPPEPPE